MSGFFNNILEISKGIGGENLNQLILSCGLLKLMDGALDYSKKDLINQYNLYDDLDNELKELLFKKAINPSGESVGFYNYSIWDLNKLSEVDETQIFEKLKIYINSFNDDVRELFSTLSVPLLFKKLSDEDLYFLITDLNQVELDETIFNSSKNLYDFYNSFLIDYYDYFNIETYNSFINSVLFNISMDMDQYENVLIDSCDDGLVINSFINNNLDVNLYAIEEKRESYSIALSRMILASNKNMVIKHENSLNNQTFDLIISNKIHENDVNEFSKYYLNELSNCSKLVFTMKSNLVNELMKFITKDVLESIIYLPIYENQDIVAVTLNKNKNDDLKEHFNLINEFDYLKDYKNISNWKYIISDFTRKIQNSNSKVIAYKCAKPIKESSNIFVNTSKKRSFSRKHMKSNDIDYHININNDEINLEKHFQGKYSKDFSSNIQKQRVDSENMDVEINDSSFKSNVTGEFNIDDYTDFNRPSLDEFLPEDMDTNVYELGELADLTILNEITEENNVLISTFNFCDKKKIFYESEITDFGHDEYIKIEIKSGLILKEFLKSYLDSNIGLKEIDYCSKGNMYVTTKNMAKIRVIVPTIDEQLEILDAVNESYVFFESIKLLKDKFKENIFDYKQVMDSINEFQGDIKVSEGEVKEMDKSWRFVYNKLIWPLAITYLSATKGGYEKSDKALRYLILFEFVAAFNSIVLISGLPDDVYQEFKRTKIWNARNINTYNNMYFGNWTYLSSNLSNLYHKQNFKTDFDRKLFDKLASNKINHLLNKLKNIRNERAHGSILTPREVELILEELDTHLSEVFDILSIYADYKLFYTTGDLNNLENGFKHTVIQLNGPCKQPIYGTMEFKKPLDGNSLYLFNPENQKILKLKHNLIRFKPIDDYERQWGIFIFNGCYTKKDGKCRAKYKYFQENEDEFEEIVESFEEHILG